MFENIFILFNLFKKINIHKFYKILFKTNIRLYLILIKNIFKLYL